MSSFKGTNIAEKTLQLLKNLPKLSESNVRLNREQISKKSHAGKRGKHGHKPRGAMQQLAYKYLGYEGGQTPYYKRIPIENSYNFGHHLRREYPPLSLYQLQLLIDTGRIDISEPIDLMKLLAARIMDFSRDNYYGINLIDKGLDIFCAKVNIEVQWASEHVIAAVEKAGGTITTAYYDPASISILRDPLTFFQKGQPLPRRMYPPRDLIDYYTDPANRGYLVRDEGGAIGKARSELAQKFGYQLPERRHESAADQSTSIIVGGKRPNQIFYGLEPGSVVNLKEKSVLTPVGAEWKDYYEGEYMA